MAVALLISSVQLFAQSITVTGKVTDASGVPIAGANVLVVDTTNGTQTDFDGNYSIDAASGDTLQFSYVGFATQTLAIGGQSVINVTMEEDLSQLDEVVVIGYGTRRKSSLTGAVAKVEGGEIAAIQAQRVDEALGGKLSGVLIQNQDGAPGADPKNSNPSRFIN